MIPIELENEGPGLKIAACQRQAIFQKWQVKKLTIDTRALGQIKFDNNSILSK